MAIAPISLTSQYPTTKLPTTPFYASRLIELCKELKGIPQKTVGAAKPFPGVVRNPNEMMFELHHLVTEKSTANAGDNYTTMA